MNYDELNEYIKHYIEKDKTRSAIMLTGGWGTGKSYYIRNVLEFFLKKNGKHRCAIVSLYGLKSTSEISKRIYFELRTIGSSKKSEALSTSKAAATIVAKTVLNGMTNMIGFDIGRISDEDLERVYSSIDLSNALVVFEDLERSNIDIIEILGYVNSLVEEDEAKVLLVANEDEILKYHESQPDKDGKTFKIPDEKTIMYLKAKEKTISDTISFNGDFKSAIKVIINSFGNDTLNMFASDENTSDIFEMMFLENNYNLRSFIFACQKTVDIYEKLDNLEGIEDYYIKTIFYGIIAFSLIIKKGGIPDWNGNDLISENLGLTLYPLYRFCYNYIRWQQFDHDKVEDAFAAHSRAKSYNNAKIKNDKDLNTVFDFHLQYEKDVISALSRIERRLQNPDDIPIQCYEQLAYNMVKCNSVIGFNYSKCKERMISNVRKRVDVKLEQLALHEWLFDFRDEEEKNQFIDFVNDLCKAPKTISSLIASYNFTYNPEDIEDFYNYIVTNKAQIASEHEFFSQFDLDTLFEMILKCSPLQIYYFNFLLVEIYRTAQKNIFIDKDRLFMVRFKDKLENFINNESSSLDKIQRFQINNLIDTLTKIINWLLQPQDD